MAVNNSFILADNQLNSGEVINISNVDRLADSFLPILFTLINHTHFNGELPESRVKWSDRIGTGKHCHRVSDFTVFEDEQFAPVIRLSKILLSQAEIEKISEALFYAMIHVYLWSQKKPWGHTREFHEKAETFNFDLVKEKTDLD